MSDVTGNDQLSFLNDVVDLDVFDKATVGYQITGTWVGTITWTGSIDGVTFFAILPVNSAAATTTANGNFWFNVNGLTRIKLAMTAYTSGTAVVNYVGNAEAISTGLPTLGGSPGTTANSIGKAEDAAHATGDVGVMLLGVANATGTSTVGADGDYTAIATTTSGAVHTVPRIQSTMPVALTQHRVLSAGSANATNVKASAGSLYKVFIANTNAAIRYVKFYNSASAPTAGAGTPVLVILCPPTSQQVFHFGEVPMGFAAGIGYTMVTGATDADAVAVTATDLLMTLLYL